MSGKLIQASPMSFLRRGLLTVAAAALAALALVSVTRAVDLAPGERADVPGAEIRYLQDAEGDLTLDSALDLYHAGAASPIAGEAVGFGQVFGRYWIFVSLHNAGEQPGTWRIATRAPFAPDLDVTLATADGRVQSLLASAYDTPFADRPVAHRHLVSDPFALAADERADLVLAYRTGGASSLPFSIETTDSLRGLLVRDGVITAAFYTFGLAVIAAFLASAVALRERLGLLYGGLFAAALLLLAQSDGLAFQFLWPAWPVWNAYSALPLLNLVCGLGFYVAGAQRGAIVESPRFRRATTILALVSVALIVPVPFAPLGPLLAATYVLLGLMIAAHVLAGLPLIRLRGGLGRTATWGAALTGIALAVLLIGDWIGVPMPALLLQNAHRLFFLVLSLAMLGTLTGHLTRLREDHEYALLREIEANRRDAELNRELFEAERNYARARDLAAQRQRQLAAASHDLRQPIAALRLSLDALTAERDGETRRRLTDAFDYLEGLTGSILSGPAEPPDETETEAETETEPAAPPEEHAEPYPLTLITETVEQMFREEAVSKGLALEVTGSENRVTVPVLPLMRLVSNLVSNAVKYTVEGAVRVSAGSAFIEVSDSGPGMTAETLAELRQPGRKGETSQGSGLGLAITDEIADSLGLSLTIDSAPGRGTVFRIEIPADYCPD